MTISNTISRNGLVKLRQQVRDSQLTDLLFIQMGAAGLPPPVAEFQFNKSRKWRADFAFVNERILIEVEGGTFTQGRHVRGLGYEKDAEKYNTAALAGWMVLRFTGAMVKDGRAVQVITTAYHQEQIHLSAVLAGVAKGLARIGAKEASR